MLSDNAAVPVCSDKTTTNALGRGFTGSVFKVRVHSAHRSFSEVIICHATITVGY
jgi:hypothetical protein